MRTRVLAGLAVAGLVAGCSLPLPRGVRSAGTSTAGQQQAGGITVLPPGPRAGAAPVDVVQGFLGAQSSSQDRHAVARMFLTPALRRSWDDGAGVQVVDAASLRVTQLPAATQDDATVVVSATATGVVGADGSYAVRSGTLTDTYRLSRVRGGDWQLAGVPAGLRLTPADRERSYRALRTYYLASADAFQHAEAAHLVPDQVLLPVDGGAAPRDLATTLVRRLLRPATPALGDSVRSAVPTGAELRSLTVDASGTVAVDLDRGPSAATTRQELSAQLVWTLRGLGPTFTGLRLTVGGRPFRVPGESAVQASGEWDAYDPDGLAPTPPVYYVAGRRLRSLGGSSLPAGPATAGTVGDGRAVPVDAVAVSPDRSRLALLSGGSTLRLGTPSSTSYAVALTRPGLHSPTWGSGGRGLWLLQGDHRVLLAGASDAPGARDVVVEDAPAGRWTSLAVSRDGVRVALVAGGRLWVGRVAPGEAPRLVGLHMVAPTVLAATAVAWEGATSLVVLGRLQQTFLPVRVAVDGSSTRPLDGPGLPDRPLDLTASPAGVVVTALGSGRASRLYVAGGSGFTVSSPGSAPAYPG